MKSIEDIKNEIQFAIDNKKIDGFIDNNCLYISSPCGDSYIIIALSALIPISMICIWGITNYFGLDVRDYTWVFLLFFLLLLITIKLSKDYIVYDYNSGMIFYSTKLFNKTICNGYYLDTRNILEIGINNTYDPKPNRDDIFKKPKGDEIFEYHFFSTLVYLNSAGKLKKLSGRVYEKYKPQNKLLLENLSAFCKLIANTLEIPCKICEANQKLKIINLEGSINKTLDIIPIDQNKEKKERLIFNIKIYILQVILSAFLPLEIVLIEHHGFWGSFEAWKEMFYVLFFEIIPKALGLK